MIVAFDALGTLFDLGELRSRMAKPLHHATSLTLAGEWLPLDQIIAALDPELAESLPEVVPYPEAREALERAEEPWILTNGGAQQTHKLLERGGLDDLVREVRSVEEVKAYKPHQDAYRLLPRDSRFISAHAWDIVGARASGLRTTWVNRDGEDWPFPGLEPDEIVPNLVAAVAGA